MKINKNVLKKAGVGLLSTGLLLFGAFGAKSYLDNQKAVAEGGSEIVLNQTEVQSVKAEQIKSGMLSSDVFAKINKSLDDNVALSESELNDLVYYLYQYSQSEYQFVSSDGNEVSTASEGFVKLLKLYQISGVDPVYTYDERSGTLTFVKDVVKPSDYDVNIEAISEKADDLSEAVVSGEVSNVELKAEVID